jgi:hypothetical protein
LTKSVKKKNTLRKGLINPYGTSIFTTTSTPYTPYEHGFSSAYSSAHTLFASTDPLSSACLDSGPRAPPRPPPPPRSSKWFPSSVSRRNLSTVKCCRALSGTYTLKSVPKSDVYCVGSQSGAVVLVDVAPAPCAVEAACMFTGFTMDLRACAPLGVSPPKTPTDWELLVYRDHVAGLLVVPDEGSRASESSCQLPGEAWWKVERGTSAFE